MSALVDNLDSNARCAAMLESIDKAYEWIESNGHLLPENCSVIISARRPLICFGYLNADDGAALATLFSGHSATKRKDGSSTAWSVTSLGIDFTWNVWNADAMPSVAEEIQL